MSHSYAQNHVHLVFSTKNREKLIAKKLQSRLWSYTAAVCKNHGILTFAVGGTDSTFADHGMRWDNSGKNGHYAPISWSN